MAEEHNSKKVKLADEAELAEVGKEVFVLFTSVGVGNDAGFYHYKIDVSSKLALDWGDVEHACLQIKSESEIDTTYTPMCQVFLNFILQEGDLNTGTFELGDYKFCVTKCKREDTVGQFYFNITYVNTL